MLPSCESQFGVKKTGSSVEKFLSLFLPGNTRTVTEPYYPISSLFSVSGRLRDEENFKLLALKVVAVACEM